MRGTLLIAMLGIGCSEYGLQAEPREVEPALFDPSARPGFEPPAGTIDAPEGLGELGVSDDGTPSWTGDGEGESDLPFFVDVEIDGDGDGDGSGDPTTGEDSEGDSTPGVWVDTDGDGIPDTLTDGAGEDGTEGWGLDTPPDEPPVDEYPDDSCDVNDLVTFSSSEIWVGANSSAPTTASGVLTAPHDGWFDVYSLPIQESGASQRNESAFFRVENATNPSGLPAFGNCGGEWVVVDSDNNGSPPGQRAYIGTFWLDAGDNTLVMTHYCEIWQTCPSLQDTTSGHTCDSGNINSVHFLGDGVCVEDV